MIEDSVGHFFLDRVLAAVRLKFFYRRQRQHYITRTNGPPQVRQGPPTFILVPIVPDVPNVPVVEENREGQIGRVDGFSSLQYHLAYGSMPRSGMIVRG